MTADNSTYVRQVCQAIDDIVTMLDHVQRRGVPLSAGLQVKIDAVLQEDAPSLQATLDVHGLLSQSIAPVTPESIRASTWENTTLRVIAWVGLASFLFFVTPTVARMSPGFENTFREILTHIQVLGAAGMGAAFYSLYTASQYLRSSTFDPQYNQIYLIRATLGILAGFILGNFAHELGLFSGETVGVMGITTLALVGGFSSEAVARVLQRVSDTLVTMVRGSGKERAEAQMDLQMSRRVSQIASDLQEVLTDEREAELKPRLQELVRELNTKAR